MEGEVILDLEQSFDMGETWSSRGQVMSIIHHIFLQIRWSDHSNQLQIWTKQSGSTSPQVQSEGWVTGIGLDQLLSMGLIFEIFKISFLLRYSVFYLTFLTLFCLLFNLLLLCQRKYFSFLLNRFSSKIYFLLLTIQIWRRKNYSNI